MTNDWVNSYEYTGVSIAVKSMLLSAWAYAAAYFCYQTARGKGR